jgi:hypothetical protein
VRQTAYATGSFSVEIIRSARKGPAPQVSLYLDRSFEIWIVESASSSGAKLSPSPATAELRALPFQLFGSGLRSRPVARGTTVERIRRSTVRLSETCASRRSPSDC